MVEVEGLVCPKCGKQGLVRRHDHEDLFQCVYCDYQHDLEKASRSKTKISGTTLLALLTALLLLILIV